MFFQYIFALSVGTGAKYLCVLPSSIYLFILLIITLKALYYLVSRIQYRKQKYFCMTCRLS